MESNVLNHKPERGKSQTKKYQYICVLVCAHTCMCVYRIGTGRAFPVLLQNPINFVQASSHFIEMILKLELVLSPYIIIQYNLGIFFSKVTHSKKDYE